jgi:cyanophycinase
MSRKILQFTVLFFFLGAIFLPAAAQASSYKYFRLGEKTDSQATPVAGTAMMGGGEDLDEAFRWLCQKANGGDFLVLRARGDDAYNPYVNGLCKLNSVATLIIPKRKAALDPAPGSGWYRTGGEPSSKCSTFIPRLPIPSVPLTLLRGS